MRVAVKLLINRRIAQPEVRAEIDDPQPSLQQCPRNFRRNSMRQGKKRNRRPSRGDGIWIRLDKRELRSLSLAETWEHRRE